MHADPEPRTPYSVRVSSTLRKDFWCEPDDLTQCLSELTDPDALFVGTQVDRRSVAELLNRMVTAKTETERTFLAHRIEGVIEGFKRDLLDGRDVEVYKSGELVASLKKPVDKPIAPEKINYEYPSSPAVCRISDSFTKEQKLLFRTVETRPSPTSHTYFRIAPEDFDRVEELLIQADARAIEADGGGHADQGDGGAVAGPGQTDSGT